MMYYRRKVLLAILEAFDGQLSRTQMQKLTFIFTRWQEKKAYDFVPYHYGCYSFQANQDLYALSKRGMIQEQQNDNYQYWQKTDLTSFVTQLNTKDKALILRLKKQFKDISTEELIRYTYLHYPFYAINSTIVEKYLNTEQLGKVTAQKTHITEHKLFTIGYEGISLEKYLNKLLMQDVKLLCDVRKNSFSMKYGFSKNQLQHACEQVGIVFQHFPGLGIESDKRKKLTTQRDYDLLFDEYESTTLAENKEHLLKLSSLFIEYPRIAITCFEARHCMCHRGRVAKALLALPDWKIPVCHL